jgi:hypothetical protein
LHEIIGLTPANFPGSPILLKIIIGVFGLLVVSAFFIVSALFFHWLMMRAPFKFRYLKSWSEFKNWATISGEFERKLLANTSLLQYVTFQFFAVTVLMAMPVKLFLRLVFTIKYVWVTPWFNV